MCSVEAVLSLHEHSPTRSWVDDTPFVTIFLRHKEISLFILIRNHIITMIDEQGYKFFYHDVELVNPNRRPIWNRWSQYLVRDQCRKLLIKEKSARSHVKSFLVLQPRHLTWRTGGQYPAKGFKKKWGLLNKVEDELRRSRITLSLITLSKNEETILQPLICSRRKKRFGRLFQQEEVVN